MPLFNSVLVGNAALQSLARLLLIIIHPYACITKGRDDNCRSPMQGFDLKQCTGLSHSVVATGAIGSCIYGLVQRSPVDHSKTLLNFDIALTLIPAMLFGVSFVSRALAAR